MNLELSKPLPDPGAKRRAIEAMQGGESDEEVMDVDDDAIQEEEIEEGRSICG
jgi:hypothetical protein